MADNIFVYTGGEQVVPADVTHVVIDRSVKIIPTRAFKGRQYLVSVETHHGIEKIEDFAFDECISLRGIKLPSVREIGLFAFHSCTSLTDMELDKKLETVGTGAFGQCTSLQKIKMPTVRNIEMGAFADCAQLTDVEFGNQLETIQNVAFHDCTGLQHIVIPLKDNMFPLRADYLQQYAHFDGCRNLKSVDVVGGIHKTIASLL
jgi:hypothetical protein